MIARFLAWEFEMPTFQEFLDNLAREQGDKERRARRAEWIAAVDRLLAQLRTWLAESDPKKVLEVIPLEVEKAEPGLGAYTIASLQIGVGRRSVQVDPMGRNAVGLVASRIPAEGRVDITDGVRRYILYRTLQEGKVSWYVLNERFEATPLDRARLEAILQDLLS
jgi:hypothetical protein